MNLEAEGEPPVAVDSKEACLPLSNSSRKRTDPSLSRKGAAISFDELPGAKWFQIWWRLHRSGVWCPEEEKKTTYVNIHFPELPIFPERFMIPNGTVQESSVGINQEPARFIPSYHN